MSKNILMAALLTMLTLAGCSANQSASSPMDVGATAGAEARIPSLVITEKRMTPAQKAAYDQGIDVQITSLKAVE